MHARDVLLDSVLRKIYDEDGEEGLQQYESHKERAEVTETTFDDMTDIEWRQVEEGEVFEKGEYFWMDQSTGTTYVAVHLSSPSNHCDGDEEIFEEDAYGQRFDLCLPGKKYMSSERVMVPNTFFLTQNMLHHFFETDDIALVSDYVDVEEIILEDFMSESANEKVSTNVSKNTDVDKDFAELCMAFSEMTCPWMVIKTRKGKLCHRPKIFYSSTQSKRNSIRHSFQSQFVSEDSKAAYIPYVKLTRRKRKKSNVVPIDLDLDEMALLFICRKAEVESFTHFAMCHTFSIIYSARVPSIWCR